jgi:hypothetical protein
VVFPDYFCTVTACVATVACRIRYYFSFIIIIIIRRRWEDNIKIDLQEIGFGDVDWIDLAQDRDRWRALVNTVMNLRVP